MAKAQKKNTKKAQKLDATALEEMSHIGERLKAVREENKLDLVTVAEELMIRRFYLQAIEEGNFKELPATVYAIGFIKNYAEFLGFDADAAVSEFKKEVYGARNTTSPELVFPDPLTTSMIPTKAAMFAGAGFVALVLVIGLIFALRDGDDVVAEIPEAPVVVAKPAVQAPVIVSTIEDSQTRTEIVMPEPSSDLLILPETVVVPVSKEVAVVAPADIVEASAQTGNVSVKAVQTSWVEIADSQGNIILSRILKANEVFEVPSGEGMKMITGNAGGVRIILDGKELPKLGSVGDVRRNFSLNAADLKKTFNLN